MHNIAGLLDANISTLLMHATKMSDTIESEDIRDMYAGHPERPADLHKDIQSCHHVYPLGFDKGFSSCHDVCPLIYTKAHNCSQTSALLTFIKTDDDAIMCAHLTSAKTFTVDLPTVLAFTPFVHTSTQHRHKHTCQIDTVQAQAHVPHRQNADTRTHFKSTQSRQKHTK